MIITAVTNEVYPDASADSLPRIFRRATEAGINHFELRIVESRRFPAYDAESWSRLKTLATFSHVDQPGDGGGDITAEDFETNPSRTYFPIAFRRVLAARRKEK